MRLTCPNCDAQYEVDVALIPDAGRDVQCSNCGKTWFQEPLDTLRLTSEEKTPAIAEPETALAEGLSGDGLTDEAAAFFGRTPEQRTDEYEDEDAGRPFEPGEADADSMAADEDILATDLVDEDLVTAEPAPAEAIEPFAPFDEPVAATDRQTEDTVALAEDDSVFDDDGSDEDGAGDTESEQPGRPEIDAAVLGILKAEAEREIAARRAESEGTEPEPEMSAEDTEPAPDPARVQIDARTARLRGEDEEPQEPVDGSARRALLPDIDEINSTLTATTDRASADAVSAIQEETVGATRKRRGGFRLGFSIVMLVTAVVILLYLFAPQIGSAVPALEPTLAAYVDWVNGIRQNVDVYLERSMDTLTSLLIDLTT